ncbi:MAG: adenosylcobinamide-GDP ribazoletransferase [bacterium]|jgi:adenosylcobinamide-GDP ribazoletransferase|nr:adenosylcobinamide-GDP ribazoletransferase [Bacillota bacterium]HHW54273.1 adenosylcobinamide-GDP ribazoletransferase [Bacillota bacterium]
MGSFLLALQFLTIVPVKRDFSADIFPRATLFFPLVGLLIGFCLGLVYFFATRPFSPLVAAASVVIGELVLTSGLHLDGFIDTVDALASGKDRDTTLAIFKDPNTGAKGVLAVIALLLAKFALLTEFTLPGLYRVLLVMPVLGRWTMVWAITLFPYVRPNGLGTSFTAGSNRRYLALTSLFTLLVTAHLLGPAGLVAMLFIGLFTHGCCLLLTRRLGGLVGDIYGALCETSELLFLLLMALWGCR